MRSNVNGAAMAAGGGGCPAPPEAAPGERRCPGGFFSLLDFERYARAFRNVYAVSSHLLAQAPEYRLSNRGDGEAGLTGRPVYAEALNCTTSVDVLMQAVAEGKTVSHETCWRNAVTRYLPGMAGSFFGRAHYYESQWRPNVINQGLAVDVTGCVARAATNRCPGAPARQGYRFRFGEAEWNQLADAQLAREPLGGAFVSQLRMGRRQRAAAIRELAASDCAKLEQVYRATREDWPGARPSADRRVAGASGPGCATPDGRDALIRAHTELMETISSDVVQALRRDPITATTPCLGTRGLDPERDLPGAWQREGNVLFVAFVASGRASDANPLSVRHQGLLVFRDGRWRLRHSSSSAGAYVEVELKDYLARNPGFVGMNLLAPTGREL